MTKSRPSGVPVWDPSFTSIKPITSFTTMSTSTSTSSSSSFIDPTSVTGRMYPYSPYVSSTVPFFRTPYNYSISDVSLETSLLCEDPSLTRQSDAEDADINVIVGRFLKTGLLPDNVRIPEYGDFTEASDYKTSLDLVRKAEQAFALYPADIRAKFNHDVGAFLDAALDGDVPGIHPDQLRTKDADAPGASPATGGTAV
jgi:hypothetical protein